MKPAGLILAAGESRRMGFPKALLEYRGETFLDRLIGVLGRDCSPVVVVLGAHADRVRAGMTRAGEAVVVENPDWAQGQISSLQCGLRAVPAGVCGVVWTLVDHPAVDSGTVRMLAGGRDGAGALLAIPRFQGRRGHPVWIASELIGEFLSVPPSGSARDVVNRHAAEIVYVDVEDPGILADIDDREAYRTLTGGSV